MTTRPADAGTPARGTHQGGPRAVFHLAFSVTDLAAARAFYTGVIGCAEGASASDEWCIFDFFGHKITATVDPARAGHDRVHEEATRLRHFGAILPGDAFHALADRLRAARAPFTIAPQLRRPGTLHEDWIMMTADPSGNALEFQSVAEADTILWPV